MSEQKQDIEGKQIIEALEELNHSEKVIRRIDSETFTFDDIEYKLIENHQDAFDMEMMEERFTDFLLKYDYIVGDVSYEKLRLRGFFENYRNSVPIDMKISNLEDYLVEYCSFGCPYFVFERVVKKEENPEPYFKPKKAGRSKKGKTNSGKGQRNSNKQANKKSGNKNRKNQDNKQQKNQGNKQQNQTKRKTAKKNFQVKKKENQNKKTDSNKNPKQKSTQSKKENNKETSFQIRKKKD